MDETQDKDLEAKKREWEELAKKKEYLKLARSLAEDIGCCRKLVATVTNTTGYCHWGHKVGDKFHPSGWNPDGLCGWFFHDIFPYIHLLEYGGKWADMWGVDGNGEVIPLKCMDTPNAVQIELRPEN